MLRALLDSDGVDPIADLPGAVDAVKAAIRRGDLELLIPERAFEQIGDALEPRRAELLAAAVVAERVLDAVFTVGRGRVGVHGVGGDDEVAYHQQIRGSHPKDADAPDALIALTAQIEDAVLVTFDKRLYAKVGAARQPAMNTYALLALIGYVKPS